MFRNFLRSFFLLILSGGAFQAGAQCVTIANLPDTVDACKNTTLQLSPTVVGAGTNLRTLDTFWTPTAGLSNPDIINPIVTVGTTSTTYKLTVTALTANNFVNNGNFNNGVTGFTSAYSPGFGGSFGLLSNEGTCAVTTNPNLVHTNFASFPDHTGNAGGQMLVVNGASIPNTNIWCQTITVVPNSQYDFSAWGASTTPTNPAVIQFAINGTLLGTPLALPGVNGQWTQFHAIWNSGSNTSIDICINDQQTAPSGNDFAIDDIEFRLICPATDSVYVRVTNLKPAIDKIVKLGCAADTAKFTALNNGGDDPDQYQWDFGDNTGSLLQNPTHAYTRQGVYTIKLLTKKRNCIDSASTTIDTRHPLVVGLKADHDTVCLGGAFQFDNSGDNTTTPPTYFYDFGDGSTGTSSNPAHTYSAVGVYKVKHAVTDQVPCSDTALVTVTVVAAPTADFNVSSSKICQGNNIDFLANATPGFDTLLWNYGDGTILFDSLLTTKHAYDNHGSFPITLTVGYPQCPTIVLTKNINVYPFPTVNIGPDTSVCPNSEAVAIVNRNYDGASGNAWSTGETGAAIVVRTPGAYWLEVTNAGGCSASDSITVRNACYLDIPNAFTPNGDGTNDYFFPRETLSSRLTRFRMQIFDRWGQLIFETNSLAGRGWDGTFNGKTQPQGVYIYLIEGQINGGSTEKYQGSVNLLR